MSNIQKQHKISPAIAWLTIQKFIIFYCPLDGEHTKQSGAFFPYNVHWFSALQPISLYIHILSHKKRKFNMCRTWGMHFFTMYDTYHPADFAAEGRSCSKYLPKSKSILDVKHYAVCGLFCIQILSREVRCFYFLSYY